MPGRKIRSQKEDQERILKEDQERGLDEEKTNEDQKKEGTMEVEFNAKRILEIKQLEDGTYNVRLEVNKEVVALNRENKVKIKPTILDPNFVLIDAENLSLDDEFMKYQPKFASEKKTKELISEASKKV